MGGRFNWRSVRNLSGLDAHGFTIVLDRQDVLAKSNLNLSDGRDSEVVLTAHLLGYLCVCFAHRISKIRLVPALACQNFIDARSYGKRIRAHSSAVFRYFGIQLIKEWVGVVYCWHVSRFNCWTKWEYRWLKVMKYQSGGTSRIMQYRR